MKIVKTASYDKLKLKESQSGSNTIKVPVSQLKPGDVLFPTNKTVVLKPSAGVRTPRGKVEVTLEDSDGQVRLHEWGRNTQVSIYHESEDICPRCGKQGGEYTQVLGECAFCSSIGDDQHST